MAEQPTRRRRTVGDLTEAIHALTAPSRHRQAYRAGWRRSNRTGPVIRDHVTDQESLIAQLRAAITDRAETQSGMHAGQVVVTTLPRFNVDAFDRMERIRYEVAQWCAHLGIASQSGKNAVLVTTYLDVIERVIDNARANSAERTRAVAVLRAASTFIATAVEPDMARLVDAGSELEPEQLDELVRHAERWCTWCRIMTGWEDSALRPHVPCPGCGAIAGERAGLRIRIEAAGGTGGIRGDAAARAGVCLSCNRTWDAGTIGHLAEQLRTERLINPA